ncbi:MAG: glycosyltransferase [Pontimonas sp.]
MKIYLAAFGSRGDNEPFRALAAKADAAGHEVYFAHTSDLDTDPGALYRELELPGSVENVIAEQGVSVVRALLNYRSVMRPLLEGVWDATTQQILDIRPDVVVYHPKVMTAALAAHAVGAIAAEVDIVPTMTPTEEFPPAGIPAGIPRSWNKAAYSLVNAGMSSFASTLRKRADDLGVIRVESDLVLCPVSPTLVPHPADWPEFAHVTGQWHRASQDDPDTELERFMSEGQIVYAGFGSMRDSRGKARAGAIVKAARSLGMKTLLVTGWGGLVPTAEHEQASDVLVRTAVPHSAVLPRVAVGIHHGGAGTTHAFVRAGTPSIIMPFLADQPWWGARLSSLGLGPKPLSRATTRPSVIAKSITEALSQRDKVERAAATMAQEDGAGVALTIIERAEAGVSPLRPA